MNNLFDAALLCLQAESPELKVKLTNEAAELWRKGRLALQGASAVQAINEPGRPDKPELVHPRNLPRRRLGSEQGRAALLHAVVHIEFNAINLAWDAVYRFRHMPSSYYDDWVTVAEDEARHYLLLHHRLNELGWHYGDFVAHNGLWDMACRTRDDLLARMALVPRVMEARGLDVTPGMRDRFRAAGDVKTADALGIILEEEVAHVAAGSRWFHYLCDEMNIDPEPMYFDLLKQFLPGDVRGPLHREARLRAGFSVSELDQLEAMCGKGRAG